MDIARQLEYHTIDDIYNLPDGRRAGLIDGELYMLATHGRIHQELVSDFTYLIKDYVKTANGDCKVFPSPFAVF